MRYLRFVVILGALLLTACGGGKEDAATTACTNEINSKLKDQNYRIEPSELRASAKAEDDAIMHLSGTAGRPLLVVYEDKDSSKLNQALKDDLSKLARGDRYRNAVALVPVADLEGYDYWRVRGFVKRAIRTEIAKLRTPIYCDWNGAFRRALGIPRGTSTVILTDQSGVVLFARSGKLSADERRQVLSALRAQVEPKQATR